MRNAKFRIDNPAFNEFLYTILYNASAETKRIIPPRLHKFIRRESDAKKFIRMASTDEAAALLAYLGVENFHVFVARDNVNFKDLKAVLDKLKSKDKVSALKDIIGLKLFVTSDKELITLLDMTAQNVQQRAYTMALELNRTGYHLHHWGKHLKDETDDDLKENSTLLAKTLLSSALTLERGTFLFRLNPLEIKLLLYLFPLRNTYVATAQIVSFFAGYVTPKKVTTCLVGLVNSSHIQRSAIAKGPEYTLSGQGRLVVGQYLAAVLHANSFH